MAVRHKKAVEPNVNPFPVELPKLAILVEALARLKAGQTMDQAAQAIEQAEKNAKNPSTKTIQRLLADAGEAAGGALHDPVERKLTLLGEEFLTNARIVVETYRCRVFPQPAHPFLVHLACYPSLSRNFLPRVLAQLGMSDRWPLKGLPSLAEQHPGASLRLSTGNRGAFFDDLQAGSLHLVLATAGVPTRLKGEIVEEELFDSEPLGIIFHKDNPNKALKQKRVRIESLATECVLWLGTERRDALEQPLSRLLPIPTAAAPEPGQPVRHGRRIVMPTYQSIRDAVMAGVGVGFGHRPAGVEEQSNLRFIEFGNVEVSEDLRHRHRKLLDQERTRFALFRREGWERPAEEGGLPEAARFVADAVRRAAVDYTHRYT